MAKPKIERSSPWGAKTDPPPTCAERYRSLIEDSSYGFYCCDAVSGKLLFLNARAGDLLGVNPAEAGEMRIWELIAPQERPAFVERLKKVLADEPLAPGLNAYTSVHPDGTLVRIEIGMHRTDFEGHAVVQGPLRDVTEYEAFQLQLEKAQRLNTVAIMADGVADRLLNAVTVIEQNIAGIESSGQAPVELLKHIAQIKGAGRQIDRLTQKLLSFSRGGMVRPVEIELNEVIEMLLPLFRHAIKPAVRIKFAPAANLPRVVADRGSLQTMLSAILANADEAISHKGRITISTAVKVTDDRWALHNPDLSPGCYVGIAIQDNGAGMDKTALRRVCEPYFSTKFHGRGLGMAAVYGIVRRHQGWLSIDSQPNQGTRVVVYLPCAEVYARQCRKGRHLQASFDSQELMNS